uniref:Uncharacterized protein n=1 Tax=Lepeophtheirus salmonis TaxID=72036 RepID=A0A0K2TTC5_LEPSM
MILQLSHLVDLTSDASSIIFFLGSLL